MEKYFGFFLFLSQNSKDMLIPTITELQKMYCNQPPFEPHLSIYHSVKMSSLEGTIAAITKATESIKPFTVESQGIEFQETWSKILYIKIKPNQILTKIRTNIRYELGDTEINAYNPHISLMYKDELSPIKRNEIVGNLHLPNTYTIQGIQIISPGTTSNDWRDYTKWEVMHSITFSK